jgi:hypothetical protein
MKTVNSICESLMRASTRQEYFQVKVRFLVWMDGGRRKKGRGKTDNVLRNPPRVMFMLVVGLWRGMLSHCRRCKVCVELGREEIANFL